MSRNDIEELLDRYLNGEASPEENERVETWLNNNGSINSEWQQLGKADKDQWLSGLFNEIRGTINNPKIIALPQRKPLWKYVGAAAAVLAIFFTAYLEWPLSQNHLNQIQLTALHAPLNQKRQITLADGSQVWVNAGSELKYPAAFNTKTREVYLSGEAYFDIKHDVSKPFIIHTGKVITTVLGTAFNIKEDKNQHTIVVTVTRGKVSVANGDEPLGIITPNQQISFNIQSNKAIQQAVDATRAIAWQKIDLHFEDQTFAEVAKQLEQRFNVKIGFGNDRIKNCRFTGASLTGEKLEKVLKTICDFNNATYKTQPDGSITIDGPGCDN